jgi:hypothetical protein
MKSMFLLIISIFISHCSIKDDDMLSLPLMPYTGNQLRIDGYYYQAGHDGKVIFTPYFFYRNGVVIYIGGAESLEEKDRYIYKLQL